MGDESQLDGLMDDAANLPAEQIPAMLARLAALQGALAARLLMNGNGTGHQSAHEDRLLDVAQAAERLSMSKNFLYRNSKTLPFAVRKGRMLRFSEVVLDVGIAGRLAIRRIGR